MSFKAECQITGLVAPQFNKAAEATSIPLRIFLGWRNSNEMLKQLEVENMNIDTNYLQTECSKEGFAYSCFKPREEKQNRKFVHATYDNVWNNRPGVSGCYFGFDLATGKAIAAADEAVPNQVNCSGFKYPAQSAVPAADTVKDITFSPQTVTVENIDIILPINDILAFQAFEDFPTGLGDIVLKFFVNKDSMVYAFCDPVAVDENEAFLNGKNINTYLPNTHIFNRRFYQVGQEAQFFKTRAADGTTPTLPEFWNGLKYDDNTHITKVTLTVNSLTCTKCQCECYGYNITQECKKQLVSLFTPANPYIIPAQQIDIKYFANSAKTAGMYTSDFTYALHNVTDFIVVFPRKTTDVTTFTNPCIRQVQLRVDGKLYPNQDYENTWDHRFWLAMMNASDLDNFFEADKEYSDSLSRRIPDDSEAAATGARMISDQTAFLLTFQAERNSNGYFFDGLETYAQNVSIQLRFSGSNVTSALHDAAPQVWFCRDTYWTVDNENGLRYWKTGTPAAYMSAEDVVV